MTPIERKARELLAAEYAKDDPDYAEAVAMGEPLDDDDMRAIRALITALTPPAGGLPELPDPDVEGVYFDGYSIATMEAYALEAIAASRVGWVMVPVEMTDEMREAAGSADDVDDCYAAMLAAAPQVALNRGGEEGK